MWGGSENPYATGWFHRIDVLGAGRWQASRARRSPVRSGGAFAYLFTHFPQPISTEDIAHSNINLGKLEQPVWHRRRADARPKEAAASWRRDRIAG